MGVIVGFIVFAIIYSLIHDILSKITGDEKKTEDIMVLLGNLFSILIFGYIFFALVYSAFNTWG
jgi:uncharacterized membrane protein YedE/YeeE